MGQSAGYRACPLIKVLLEPPVQAAGEGHPADLPGGGRAESRESPIGFWPVAGKRLLMLGRAGELHPSDSGHLEGPAFPAGSQEGLIWGGDRDGGASSEKFSPKSMTYVLE